MNKRDEVETAFERALEHIQARVSVLGYEKDVHCAVAYSGGLDSSVLLHLACRYAQSRSIKIHAFHVHHGLSPNADEWLAHCRVEAGKLGAAFDSKEVKIDAGNIGRHGTEEAARIERYKALRELCLGKGVRLLLAAHHQDDQAETMMLQLMRGAGLSGLSGMALLQEDHGLLGNGLLLGRPLLEMGRAALEGYAGRHSLSYVSDESNHDPAYRRNALRRQVFPLLEEHFPGFSSCVARSAEHVQSAQEILKELAQSDLQLCQSENDDAALKLDCLEKLSPQRGDNLLRHWLAKQGVQTPSTARLAQLRQQLFGARPDRQPVLNFGPFILSRAGNQVMLRPDLGQPPQEEMCLQWRGEHELAVPGWRGVLLFERVEGEGIAEERLREALLVIKPRSGRETLKPAGKRPSKTLKNLFQEASIPVWQREWLPLFYLEQKLIFAAGLGMDVRHCASGAGVRLTWRPDWQNPC